MSKIKICGLIRPEDVDAVNEVLPDYVGFVFAKSRRQVSAETAALLKRRLHPEIKAVGVFVNEGIDTIVNLCSSGTIDLIQLHGDEDRSYLSRLRALVPNEIIKAVRLQREENNSESLLTELLPVSSDNNTSYIHGMCAGQSRNIEALEDAMKFESDYLLLDTYHKGQYGGSGVSFDWSIVKDLKRPYFLAGGLNLENVSQAIHTLSPYGVDISSGVETDGRKDADKIREISMIKK